MPITDGSMNVHIPHITIDIGDMSLSWRADENRPDYFISLSHTRTVDTAGEMSISITFVPHYGENPNRIEYAMVDAGGECIVQYGDLGEESKTFKALIYSYSIRFDNGCLSYDLKLVSRAVTYNFDTVPGKTFTRGTFYGDVQAIYMYMRTIVNKYMNPDYYWDMSDESSKAIEQFRLGENEIGDSVSVPAGLGVIEHIRYIAHRLTPRDGDPTKRLEVIIDDTPRTVGIISAGTVKLVTRNDAAVDYTFEWGTRNGTVLNWSPGFDGAVAIFAARNAAYSGSAGGDDADYTLVPVWGVGTVRVPNPNKGDWYGGSLSTYVNPNTGELNTTRIMAGEGFTKRFLSGDDWASISLLQHDYSDFIQKAEYSYTGTLEVLGDARDVTVAQTVIQITPIIMGQPHHTAGKYLVKGVTDSVSAAGFTTTLEVYRQDINGLYSDQSRLLQNKYYSSNSGSSST